MTASTSRVPYGEIVAALRDLCTARSTGTLFIATDDNHAVRIGVNHGQIVTLEAGDRRDEAAIPVLRAIKSGSYRFQQGRLFDSRAADKPPVTERLLAALEGGRPAPSHPSPAANDTLTQVREIVESEAVDVIGPIAGVLCAEHCAEVGDLHSLKQALERIAVEIRDPDRAEELQRRVMERLSESLPAFA